jgi:UPF0271 protein
VGTVGDTAERGAPTIDLNADLGESFGAWRMGDDAGLLEVITSANVACGFHGGDPGTMRAVCGQAVERGVVIGAQVSYRDLVGFGRRYLAASRAELTDDVLYQLGALSAFASAAGGRVTYLKPHGALYNTVVDDVEHARAVVDAVTRFDPSLAVVGLPGSQLLSIADEAGLRTVPEAFCDRAYTASGRLVSRREPGAVLSDPAELGDRARGLVRDRRLTAVDGTVIEVDARTLCVHGDTPSAGAIARAVREALEADGVALAPFAPPG